MQVSSISTPNFSGRRDNVDALINLDDASVQRIAYLKTISKSEEKKHNRITNALFAASPVAAGLCAAAFMKGNTKIFSKEVSGLAARAANALKVGGLWGAALTAVGLVGMAKSDLSRKSQKVRDFDRNHPFLSLAGLFAAGYAAICLVNKGAAKIAAQKAPEFLKNATGKVANFINKNKQIGAVKNGLISLSKKTPSALKHAGAVALGWAPDLFLLGGIIHAFSHGSAVNKEFAKNYSDIKEKQLRLAQSRQRELTMENDFLKTDPQNREDVELLNNPLAGLSEEVADAQEVE